MPHKWVVGGKDDAWVFHSARELPEGRTFDTIGIGPREGDLGPFPGFRDHATGYTVAQWLADALNHAYGAGTRDGRHGMLTQLRQQQIALDQQSAKLRQLQEATAQALAAGTAPALDDALVEVSALVPDEMVEAARKQVRGS